MRIRRFSVESFLGLILGLTAVSWVAPVSASELLSSYTFTGNDSVLVENTSGEVLLSWRANRAMIPASLTKLATAHLAIEKWGLSHQFHTDFYRSGDVLWVKGYGDPFVISEELDLIVTQLGQQELAGLSAIHVDNSYFDIGLVPGRTRVSDPYNAPLSAVAANFNTAKIRRDTFGISSAEPQTPLTDTAKRLSRSLSKTVERVNLVTSDNAQRNFAELLMLKLALPALKIKVNQVVPDTAQLIYRHYNTHTLADVLRGTLEFSNNFMANQVFLSLGKHSPLTFNSSQSSAEHKLAKDLNWSSHVVREGSGLSRTNRLSALQINDLLKELEPNKSLFKKIKHNTAEVYAKTGTLDGVRSYAGYINFANRSGGFRFVFMFNRKVPWRYREKLLDHLIEELSVL